MVIVPKTCAPAREAQKYLGLKQLRSDENSEVSNFSAFGQF